MSILIRNGRIVTAADDYRADVFIQGETVTLIGRDLVLPADRVIDAAGRLVIPGGVDPHTHMEMPFGGTHTSDTFETGTRAAAFGGTTCIVDFAIQSRGLSTIECLDAWHAKAAGKTAIDYAFHMIITDLPDHRVPEMRRLADEGVTSYKMFMAYPGVMLSDDGTIFRAMRKAGEDGTLVCMHAENGIVIDELVKVALSEGHIEPKYHALTRPTRLEAEGVHRALAIAEVARSPVYIVHLSCHDALEELRRAQARGVMAHAETCPQYLILDVDAYDEPGFDGAKYVLTPPLREKWNQEELWRGLRSRDLDVISTDHCPFCMREQKELGRENFGLIPNGGPGVESRMSLIFHHGGQRRAVRCQPLRGAHLHRPGPHLRDVPAQGHDRGRVGRRHRDLRSRARGHHQPARSAHPPHERRLQRLRGVQGAGVYGNGALARQGRDRRRGVRGAAGRRAVREARPLRRSIRAARRREPDFCLLLTPLPTPIGSGAGPRGRGRFDAAHVRGPRSAVLGTGRVPGGSSGQRARRQDTWRVVAFRALQAGRGR